VPTQANNYLEDDLESYLMRAFLHPFLVLIFGVRARGSHHTAQVLRRAPRELYGA
jgi:hypothetical protein